VNERLPGSVALAVMERSTGAVCAASKSGVLRMMVRTVIRVRFILLHGLPGFAETTTLPEMAEDFGLARVLCLGRRCVSEKVCLLSALRCGERGG